MILSDDNNTDCIGSNADDNDNGEIDNDDSDEYENDNDANKDE